MYTKQWLEKIFAGPTDTVDFNLNISDFKAQNPKNLNFSFLSATQSE